MIPRIYCVGVMLSIALAPARSEWIPLKNSAPQRIAPRVTLLHDDLSSSLIRVDVSGFETTDLVVQDRVYRTVDLLTGATTTDAGFPEIPCVTKILAVPDQSTVSVELVEMGEEISFSGYVIPPARYPAKEGDPEAPYVERDDAYQSSRPYPQNVAVVDPPGVFRDFRITRIALYPLRYIAARNELRIATSITVRVKYEQGIGINPKTGVRKPIAPSFAALYRSTIFNYQTALERDYNGMETGRDVLLCISPDAFVNSLMPFVNWRHKTGTFVKVTKFSEIGANPTNPDIIKNYLAQVYHNWEYPPTYVLLVGDYGQVPIKQITYDYTIVSENYFVEIDGSDFFPEMMIGRFTHEVDAVEQIIVNKIVGYERNPYTINTAWFKKGVVAANDEYPSQLETKRFTRDRMMVDGGFTTVDSFMNHSPCYSSLGDLINVLNNGRSFLNYRGEGWYTGWWASCYNFQTANVTSVNNGRMLTFVTSIGCGVGAFNQSNCFGEQWLELGTVAAPRGAVTFIGPTSNTHTTYNNRIDKGIYMGMFQEGLETPGQALARGRLHMYEVFGNERWVEYQTRVYCVLGDPSVHIWKDVPRSVTVYHPSAIPMGYNQVEFTVIDSATRVPVGEAQVCLAGDSVYTTGYTDALGKVILPITPEVLDTLTVLVRGGNVVPYEGSMEIRSETEHVAPFGAPQVVDLDGNLDGMINPNEHGQIRFTLKNWGTQTAFGVQATLSADTHYVHLQTVNPVTFGDIATGGSQAGSPFDFFVKPTCSVGDTIAFNLHVTSTNRSWDYTQNEDVKGCKLTCDEYIVDDRAYSRSNARMDPGETVKLYMKVANVGEDIAPNITATLRCSSPFVTISDSTSTFGTMSEDSSYLNYTDFFVVTVDSLCPPRTMLPFGLHFETQGGLYAYSVVDTFSIPVSIPRRADPTGPDAYGYYAYASDDTLFEQAPKYNWTELNGIGTQVTGASGNFTSTFTLPFTFKYYGLDYTQVRLSSDGWIAFGSGTQVASNNYCLPRNDNVNSMVAAFWLNLFATSGETGKLLYYYDVARHRFLVEWYNVGHSNDVTKKETFQIVLHDPEYYPTSTGDGDILMQYLNTADPGENTVGIENHNQSISLQYICGDQPDYDESVTPLRDTLAVLFTTRTPQLLVGVSEDHPEKRVPARLSLEQNYPNPFNPETRIRYEVPAREFVSLKVYDVLGREVATLVNQEQSPGSYVARWDAGARASGVYFYRLTAGGYSQTRKLLLLR